MEMAGNGTATEGEEGRRRDLRTYPLTSLQIGDMTSYHSALFIYVSHVLQKLIFFVDNSPWTDDGPRSKSVEVWQYLLMQSRRSPFVNWKLERARRHRIKEEEKALLKGLEDSAGWECQRQMSQAKLKAMGHKIVAFVKARKKRASHGLYGCVVFELDWDDLRGINYVNELQAAVFFAIEARTVQKREFDDLGEAYEYYMAKEGPEEEDEEGDEDEDDEDDDGYDEKEDDPDGDNFSHDGDDENVLYDEDEVEEEEEEDRRDECMWKDEQDEEEVAVQHEEEGLWDRCEDRQGRWACERRRGDVRAQLSGVSDCSISGQRARLSSGRRGDGGLPRVCNAVDMPVMSTPSSVGWPLRLSSHVDHAGHSGGIGISEVRDCRSEDRRDIVDRVGGREGVLASNSSIGGSEGFTGRGKFLSATSRHSQCIVGKSHLETAGNQEALRDIGWYSEARQGVDSSSRRESGSGWERDDEGDFDDERDCIESDPELFFTPPSSPRGWMQSEASERNDAWGSYTLRRRRRARECRSPVSDGCAVGNGRPAQQWFPPGVRDKPGRREVRDCTIEPEFSFDCRKGGKTVDMSLCSSRSVGGVGGLSVQNHDPRSYCSIRTRGCNDRYGGLTGFRGQEEPEDPPDCSPEEETESDQPGNEQSTDDGDDECDGPDQSGEEDEEATDGSGKHKNSSSYPTAASLSASRECSVCLSGSVSDSLVSVSSTASSDLQAHLPPDVPQSCFVQSGTVTGDVADVYKDMLIAVRFEDPLLPIELRQMITHDQKRLKMLESGLPSWAIFCQSYPLTRNLYRPWMRALSVYIFFLISLTTVLIGFYDLYKNVPVLKEALHRVFGPLVEWVDAWEVGSRLKYLGTMLFLQNCQKAFRWIMTLSRGLMEVAEFFLKPLERPIWLLSEIMLLPVWNMLVEFCLDVFGLGWSTICAVKTVSEWILMGFVVPLFDGVRLLWYCVEALVYPLFAAVWAVMSLPFTLVSCLVDILVALSVGIFEGLRLIFSMIGTLSRMVMSFRRMSVGIRDAKVVVAASPSTWRSLYQEIFSKVFYAIRGIVNGILTFALACNRHRVSIYNYMVMKWESLEECMEMTVKPKPLKQETALMKRAADPPSRIQQAALRQAEHIRSQTPQLRMALQVTPRTGPKPDSGRRVNCPSFVSPEVMRPLSGEGHGFGSSGGNGSVGARRSLMYGNRTTFVEQSRGSLSDCSPVRSRANAVGMTKARLRRTRGGSDGVEQKVLDTVALDDYRRLAPSGFSIPERVARSEQPTQPPWPLGIPHPVSSNPRCLYSDVVPEQPSIPAVTPSPCSSRSQSPSFSSVSFSSHFGSPNGTSSSSTGSTPERRRPSIPAQRLSVPHVVSRSAPSVPESFTHSQPTFSSGLASSMASRTPAFPTKYIPKTAHIHMNPLHTT